MEAQSTSPQTYQAPSEIHRGETPVATTVAGEKDKRRKRVVNLSVMTTELLQEEV